MSTVDLTIEDGIAELCLNNPDKMNAFTLDMLDALESHLDRLDRDASVRCVVLVAEGERAFCTGADINGWGDLSPAEFARFWVRDGHRIFDRLARLSKPTVAALNGYAFGGGLELAAACDIRVMAKGAALALPEARVGIVPGWSGTQRLARIMPEPMVREMALFGRRISADRALACGFVAEVAEDVREKAHLIAQGVAKLSPRATEIAKNMINAAANEDRAAMTEALGAAAVAASADRDEGVAAFRDKRKPEFRGEQPVLDFNVRSGAESDAPVEPVRSRHFIDGNFIDGPDGSITERVSPSHGVVVSRSAKGGAAETEAAIASARAAFDDGRWSRASGKERATVLLRVADLIEQNVERFARIETLESGKPISQSRGEVGGAADLWRYAASLARTSHGDSHNTLGEDMLGVVLKEPIGVVSIITPWNFPFWILSQKLPFALAAGCTCVVKPSEFTPSTTAMLADLLVKAGLPCGVCNIVLGHGDPVGSLMSSHRHVDMVTFTGSTAVGKLISATASDTLKKVALELGGKNPQVIFPDADLESGADAVTFGVYFNVGQCCNSSSRIIVHEDIADDFVARVVELSKKVVFGDPMNPDTQVGAIVTPEHNAKIDASVKAAVAAGAEVVLGGGPLHVPGLGSQFYQPTVIRGVTPDMAIARDEVFGPVLSVLTFRDFEEAVRITNDATYGLSAGVWSENTHTCLDFARRANAGTVWTNTWMDGFPEIAFGGMRQSGQGREIGRYGFEEFLEVKSLVMRIGRTREPWVKTF